MIKKIPVQFLYNFIYFLISFLSPIFNFIPHLYILRLERDRILMNIKSKDSFEDIIKDIPFYIKEKKSFDENSTERTIQYYIFKIEPFSVVYDGNNQIVKTYIETT